MTRNEEPSAPDPIVSPAGAAASAEEDLLEELAEQYLDDLRAGRIPAHVELILAYPELAVPLVRRLSLIRRLHRAGSVRPDVPGNRPTAQGRRAGGREPLS